MFYLDTSVLVPYYCPEPLSDKAEAFIMGHSELVVSRLTELEMFSAVSRKLREKQLRKSDATRILTTFSTHVDNGLYMLTPVTDHHYRLARDWMRLPKNTLRSLDALHLAVASTEGMTIVTADQRMALSAKGLGVEIIFMK